ncbi:7019_t:CDS:2, partial [Acaulospora colombiana]
HRLGQVNPVVATKFIIRNSIEERLLQVQQKKADLAKLTLGKPLSKQELQQRRLAELHDLLGAEELSTYPQIHIPTILKTNFSASTTGILVRVMSGPGPNDAKPSLQDRLGSLFTSSPRSSVERSHPPSPHVPDSSGVVAKSELTDMSRRGSVASISSNASKQLRNPPLIRWLSGSSTANGPYHHRAPSDSHLMPASSSKAELTIGRRSEDLPASDTQISEEEASAALKQAISDEVFKIRKPPEARMATHPEGKPFRHPVLLDNLARASMPTSSLTKPLNMTSSPLSIQPKIIASPTSYTRPVQGVTRTDARSSIDSLRSLTARDRGIQTSTSTGMSPIVSNVNRWWFQDGNKETVDQMLGDDDKAATAQEEAEGIRKKSSFAPLQITHWRGIKEVLEENGIEVLVTKVPATSGVEERARVLGEKIAEADFRRTQHASHPKDFTILSVTTIATPHRGSYFADYFLETLGKARIPSLVSFLDYLPNGGGDGKAFEGLTREAMRKFNEDIRDLGSFIPSKLSGCLQTKKVQMMVSFLFHLLNGWFGLP